jgi:hypothetical protein
VSENLSKLFEIENQKWVSMMYRSVEKMLMGYDEDLFH